MKSYKNIKTLWLILNILFGTCFFIPAFAQADIPDTQIKLNSLSLEELQQAADSGDPDAQYALGYLYYYGKNNVPQNMQLGIHWIKRASVQGQEQAIQAMRVLAPGNAASTDTITAPANPAVIANQAVSSGNQKSPAKNITKTTSTEQKSVTTSNNYYAIQLSASANKNQLESYAQTHGLQGKTAIQKNGRNYILLYGHYATHNEAAAALAKLPAVIKAQKPWVKAVSE